MTTAETGAPWNLSLERFAEQLAARRPDALIAVDPDNPQPQVSFELTLGDGRAEGAYFTGTRQQMICWDGTIDDWAPIVEWLLGLLPLESDANIFLEAVAVPQELPRLATAADISRILSDLENSVN